MRTRAEKLVEASRVSDLGLSPKRSGLWTITERVMPDSDQPWKLEDYIGLEPGELFTTLQRVTGTTVHLGGAVVMEDSRRELRRHLPILLPARGRVLVSGLGLGCVVRGLLSKPEVEHVDVVEVDEGVAGMVWPTLMTELDPNRVRLHIGDALTYRWPPGTRWDFAWHDIWREHGGLEIAHAELMARYDDHVVIGQGAWQFPRVVRRQYQRGLSSELLYGQASHAR